MATLYTLKACDDIINKYINNGGEVIELEKGTLGYGLTVCFGEGLKTCIITEKYLNEWSSGHSIRFYNNTPKKYEQMIEKWYEEN